MGSCVRCREADGRMRHRYVDRIRGNCADIYHGGECVIFLLTNR